MMSFKTVLSIAFVFLGVTCWLWPCVFVQSLVNAVKKIKENESYSKDVEWASFSLMMMAMSPFVIALLVTS